MTLARQNDDLFAEPSLDEALADPVIQAVMLRDGVSRDEVVRVAMAARTRLLNADDGVVTAFPRASRPAETARPYRGAQVRPRVRALLVAPSEAARR